MLADGEISAQWEFLVLCITHLNVAMSQAAIRVLVTTPSRIRWLCKNVTGWWQVSMMTFLPPTYLKKCFTAHTVESSAFSQSEYFCSGSKRVLLAYATTRLSQVELFVWVRISQAGGGTEQALELLHSFVLRFCPDKGDVLFQQFRQRSNDISKVLDELP